MMREEAINKTAFHLKECEDAPDDMNVGKHLSLAQLYLSLAHELNLSNA